MKDPFSNGLDHGHASGVLKPPPELTLSYEEICARRQPKPKPKFNLNEIPGLWRMEMSVQWVVQHLVVQGGINLVTGDSGVGKSIFALHLAGKVTEGKPFLGFVTAQKRVLYVDGENPAAIVKERLGLMGITERDNLLIWGGWHPAHAPQGPDCEAVLAWAQEQKENGLIIYDSLIEFHSGS